MREISVALLLMKSFKEMRAEAGKIITILPSDTILERVICRVLCKQRYLREPAFYYLAFCGLFTLDLPYMFHFNFPIKLIQLIAIKVLVVYACDGYLELGCNSYQ